MKMMPVIGFMGKSSLLCGNEPHYVSFNGNKDIFPIDEVFENILKKEKISKEFRELIINGVGHY